MPLLALLLWAFITQATPAGVDGTLNAARTELTGVWSLGAPPPLLVQPGSGTLPDRAGVAP